MQSVSSPSPPPPRPLPRASLATISGGQTSPTGPPPPLPPHQQHPLQAISESSASLDIYPPASVNMFPNRDNYNNSSSGVDGRVLGGGGGGGSGSGSANAICSPTSAPISPRTGGRQKANLCSSNCGDASAALRLDVSARNNNLDPVERKQKSAAKCDESSGSLDSLDSGVVISDNSKQSEKSTDNSHSSSHQHHSKPHHSQRQQHLHNLQQQQQHPQLSRSSLNPSRQVFENSSLVESFPSNEGSVVPTGRSSGN